MMVVAEVMVVGGGEGACGQGTEAVRIYLVGEGRDHQGGNAERAGGWSGVVPFPVQARLRQGRKLAGPQVGARLFSAKKKKTGRDE